MTDCKHVSQTTGYDHHDCNDCGAFKTDSQREWGIARNMWFRDRHEAEFYQKNGRLPEDRGSSLIDPIRESLFLAKNHWADRARKAEDELQIARSILNRAKYILANNSNEGDELAAQELIEEINRMDAALSARSASEPPPSGEAVTS